VLAFVAGTTMFPVTGTIYCTEGFGSCFTLDRFGWRLRIRRVPLASPCGLSPQSYDDAIRSGRHPLRHSSTPARPRVEGSLHATRTLFSSGSCRRPC